MDLGCDPDSPEYIQDVMCYVCLGTLTWVFDLLSIFIGMLEFSATVVPALGINY